MKLFNTCICALISRSEKNQQISLRNIRKLFGYSASFVANALNISTSTLYTYERDPSNIYPYRAAELARVYGVKVDDITFL